MNNIRVNGFEEMYDDLGLFFILLELEKID